MSAPSPLGPVPAHRFDVESQRLLSAALGGGRLPRWAAPAAATAGLLVALLLNLTTGVDGVAGTLVVAALVFLVLQTGCSLAVEGRRHCVDRLATTAVHGTFVFALVPLVSVLWTVVSKGIAVFDAEFFTTSMRNVSPGSEGGGIYHALIGTVQQVGIAALVAVPLGVLAAVYLAEYGSHARRSMLPNAIGFFVDVMTGVPSVIVGLFVYTSLVLTLGMERSGLAAAAALMILMLPVVVRSALEMLRIVPHELREASYALGVPKWLTVLRVVLPTALPGIITGAMLAIARAAGETAPLLLTTFLSKSINSNPFEGPQASLPTLVWDQIGSSTDASTARAWGGALVLVLLVMVLYLGARLLARMTGVKT